MKYLNKRILEAINTGVRMGLSLDDFNDTDDKLPTLKKNIRSKAHNTFDDFKEILKQQCETLKFNDNFIDLLEICKDFKWAPLTKADLINILNTLCSQFDNEFKKMNLNWIDTSKIIDMSALFKYSEFNGDISKWNVSNVKDMSQMFSFSLFKGDISKWNVSHVTNMANMFEEGFFNNDISKWDVSSVKDMQSMFNNNKLFNGNISNWNVSNVENMNYMFNCSIFNGDISRWNVSQCKNMHGMFQKCSFNGDISNWDVSNVKDMGYMFYSAPNFNGDLSKWDMHNARYLSGMFRDCKNYNCTIDPIKNNLIYYNAIINDGKKEYLSFFDEMFSGWPSHKIPAWYKKLIHLNVISESINSRVRMGLSLDDFNDTDDKLPTLKKNIRSKPYNVIEEYEKILRQQCETLQFDENTEYYLRICKDFKWKVFDGSELKTLISEYLEATNDYKGSLNWIDTSEVVNFESIFYNEYPKYNHLSKFNGNISKWNTSKAIWMKNIFKNSNFNGNISNWDVSNVKDMNNMFNNSKFNKDISKWDVSNVVNMGQMFADSKFDKDISNWDVSNVQNMNSMFFNSKFNGDISNWNVHNVRNMGSLFAYSKFTGDISKWNVHKVQYMGQMFAYSKFSGNISNWNVSNVTDMKSMFMGVSSVCNLSKWNFKNVTSFCYMYGCVEQKICTIDPKQNNFSAIYTRALLGESEINGFYRMFQDWNNDDIPEWYSKLVEVGKDISMDIL